MNEPRQLTFPGMKQLCETGSTDHFGGEVAVGEFLVGDDFVWLCKYCFHVLWPDQAVPA
jgi:hypothetical protein